jgi:60 kDa SS-A/Ro ribonucleoprotein
MRTNVALKYEEKTAEGAQAARITPEQELRRSVAACMLWEDGFYESGQSIADRIKSLIPKCRPSFVAACAFEARTKMKLRHVPLLLVREMARLPEHRNLVGQLLPSVIQRADELSEFVSIYWKDKRQPLSKQVKIGLATAFGQFNEYQLAKYNRDGAVKLRDVLFLCHAKPKDKEQEALWKRLVENKLETPETWEVQLSGGKDKAETFIHLMLDKKLGALAFLRNLRNMHEAGIDAGLIQAYAQEVDISRVLPFRFIAAARAVPQWEHLIEPMMLKACEGRQKLPGHTVLLIDGSASMSGLVSSKSDISRRDAACALAILLRELCDDVRVVGFSSEAWDIPSRRGFALRDAIEAKVIAQSTLLGKAVRYAQQKPADRIIVITDEQSQDKPPNPAGTGYVINVSTDARGIGYGPWTHIDGWSEAVIDYIQECETAQ